MANEMDKFVLQYEVTLKDAVAKLEQLNDKVEKTNKKSKEAGASLKDFATGATDEIGKLIPGVDKVSGAVKIMSAEFVAAGAAIAVLAAGVKSVMALRDQFGQQRLAGMDTGVSGLRMEEYQRKFVKSSNGNVSRDLAQDQIKNLSERLQGAYADPTRISQDNIIFKRLGVDIGERGKGPIPFNQSLQQLATRFSKMKPEQVQGNAKAIGMNQDFALTLAKLGASVGSVTELTEAEINKRKESEASLLKFNNELATLQEKFTELEISLGEHLLPAFTKIIEVVRQLVDLIPKDSASKVSNVVSKQADFVTGKEAPSTSFWENWKRHPIAGGGPLGALYRTLKGNKAGGEVVDGKVIPMNTPSPLLPNAKPNAKPDQAAPSTQPNKASDKPNKADSEVVGGKVSPMGTPSPSFPNVQPNVQHNVQPNASGNSTDKRETSQASNKDKSAATSLDKLVTQMDENNRSALESSADMKLAINMFVGAVSTFANAIDEKAAWAAWAGEVGAGAGLKAPAAIGGNSSTSSAAVPGSNASYDVPVGAGNNKYDKDIEDASKKYGLDPAMLKRQIWAESRFKANAVSEAGAQGMMQLMPEIQKAYGIKNAFDPRENIMGGARLMAENLKATDGDYQRALMMYHGGTNEKNWGPRTRQYAKGIMGANSAIADAAKSPDQWDGVSKAGAGGNSRDKLQYNLVQANIADALGVPLAQLQHGAVNRGDVAWKSKQIQAGLQNHIFDYNKQLAQTGIPQATRSKIMTDLRDQEAGLAMMRKFSPRIEAESRQGDQSITIGERAIVINVNGAFDPKQTANVVQDQLQGNLGELVNGAQDGIKY